VSGPSIGPNYRLMNGPIGRQQIEHGRTTLLLAVMGMNIAPLPTPSLMIPATVMVVNPVIILCWEILVSHGITFIGPDIRGLIGGS
jgi:hypothetical protein